MHYYDPHEEYRPPTRFADAASGPHRLYDGEIAYMDSEIGRLLQALPQATVVAAVGDHGEMLGEHGELTHGVLPFAAARRVPLMLAGPGVPAAQSRTAWHAPRTSFRRCSRSPGSTSRRASTASRSSPAGPGAACSRVSYSESFLPYYAYKWYPLRTLSDGRALFLQAPQPALFRLDSDPGEAQRSRRRRTGAPPALGDAARAPARGGRGEARGGAGAAGDARRGAAPPARQSRLSLRRRSGERSGSAVAGDLPDPRERVGIAQALHTAAARIQQGGCAEVLRELERIVREDPHNFPALALSGQCLRDAGRHADALRLYERAAQENPASAVPVANVAGSLLQLGRRAEAEREFRHALALDPTEGDSAANLARLLRDSGRGAEALAILDRTIAAGGTSAQLFLERGTMRATAGRLEEALADFREAVRRAPTDPLALENAARALFALGRLQEAALAYETLARLAARPRRRLEDAGGALSRDRRRRGGRALCAPGAAGGDRSGGPRAARGAALGALDRSRTLVSTGGPDRSAALPRGAARR